MNILILISLFLGIFTHPAFASEINIEIGTTEGIIVGTTFPVSFQVVEAEPNTSYHFKFYGGQIGDTNSIQTYSPIIDDFVFTNIGWATMPSFNTNSSGNATVSGIAKIPESSTYCPDPDDFCYFLFIQIAKFVTNIGFSSVPQELKVLAPPPTPTLTPIPTAYPTSHNQVPTLTPTPTPDMKIFGTTTTSVALPTEKSILISDLISPDPNPTFIETGSNPVVENKNNPPPQKINFFPLIFISLGGLFLLAPLIISKIKFKS